MNGTPEDASLIALAAAVSDGTAVDWDQAEREAADSAARRLVQQMRRLAAVVDAHRPESPSATPVRHWRHIVLFESIGAGAFGTVYRGWDPTLDREVAVKLLPDGAADADHPLEEARNLARVRHSNVVVVYGADRDRDEVGIWMEHIQGHTLADMVHDGGPMSAREVTGIGIDLCRALAALHGVGLLHRDIKAHNVMREVGGRIVLMDFSGAERFDPARRSGVTSGTPMYMAPELFEKGPATFATEVYSLGVLLFYLLSGQLPVEGKSLADLRRAHAEGERRRLRDLRPDVPDSIVQVVERATAPDPRQRYRTVGELEHALATASGTHAVVVDAPPVPGTFPRSGVMTWAAAVLTTIVVALAGSAVYERWKQPLPAAPVTHFTIGPPFTSGSWPRISPDGRFVVFGAIVEGSNRFWVRALDEVDGHGLMNTTATESPFWSPDGVTLCFFEAGKLKRISVLTENAPAETLADAPQPHGGDWRGSTIVFARSDGIYKIELTGTGAAVSKVTAVDASRGEYQHGWPEFLSDGRRFLFIIRGSQPDRAGLYLGFADGSAPRRLMPAATRVRYVDGHLLYVRQGTLVAQAFDEASATVRADPVPLATRLKYHASSDAAFDVSENGVLVYGQAGGDVLTRLMLLDARGRELRPLAPAGSYRSPAFSPDGRRVIAEKVDPNDRNVDLWMYDLERGGVSRLTSTAAPDVKPVWSPDGGRIAFSSKRGSVYDVYTKALNTTATEEALVTGSGDKFVEDWSHDGRYLSGTVLRSGLWVFPVDHTTKPWMVHGDPKADSWQSEFSPDGRWIAYTSCDSGSAEVYVEPIPATGARWQVSAHGGAEPHWRGDGRELLYLSPDGMLMSAGSISGNWHRSSPLPLFRLSVPDLAGNNDYAVSPDGRFIVVNTFMSDPVVPPIDVVVNWPRLLRR